MLNPLALAVIAYCIALPFGIVLLARYLQHRDHVRAIRQRLRDTARRY